MATAGRVLLMSKGAWVSGTSYSPMDYVYYGGNSYVCKSASSGTTTPDLDTTHWQVMASGFDISMFEHLEEDIAPIEDTATASQNYAVGEYLFNGGQLYIVSTAITAGDTLTPGTNITAAVLADDVTELQMESDLTKLSLAPVEGATASRAYYAGERIIYNGRYYRVTASTAAGATWIVGTNITADTVASTTSRSVIQNITGGTRFRWINSFVDQKYLEFNCTDTNLRANYVENGSVVQQIDLIDVNHQVLYGLAHGQTATLAVWHGTNTRKIFVAGHSTQPTLCGLYMILDANTIAPIVAASSLAVSISNWTLTVTNNHASSSANGVVI